jgi:hypothetical protein
MVSTVSAPGVIVSKAASTRKAQNSESNIPLDYYDLADCCSPGAMTRLGFLIFPEAEVGPPGYNGALLPVSLFLIYREHSHTGHSAGLFPRNKVKTTSSMDLVVKP